MAKPCHQTSPYIADSTTNAKQLIINKPPRKDKRALSYIFPFAIIAPDRGKANRNGNDHASVNIDTILNKYKTSYCLNFLVTL